MTRVPTTVSVPPARSIALGRFVFWAIMIACATAAAILLYTTRNRIVSSAIALAPIFFGTLVYPRIGLYAYFALQAWDASTVLAQEAVLTPAKLFAFVVLIGFAIGALRHRVQLRESRTFVILTLVYSIWAFVPAAFSVAPLAAVRYAAQHIVQVFLLVAAIDLIDTRERLHRLMFWAVISATGAAVVMFLFGGSRMYTRTTLGEFTNPVSVALALGTGFMCIPAAWAATRRRSLYIAYVACGVVLLVGILLTGTRAVLVGLLLALAVGGLLTKRVSWPMKVSVAFGGVMVFATVFAVVLSSGILDRQSQERFEALVYRTEDSGAENVRWTIWANAMKLYADHWLLGIGMGNTTFTMEREFGWRIDIHNSYLAPLIDTGPVGALLFWAALVVVIRRVRGIGLPGPGLAATMMLIFVFFAGLTHTIQSTKWFWIPMTVCLLLAERKNVFLDAPSTGESYAGAQHRREVTPHRAFYRS